MVPRGWERPSEKIFQTLPFRRFALYPTEIEAIASVLDAGLTAVETRERDKRYQVG